MTPRQLKKSLGLKGRQWRKFRKETGLLTMKKLRRAGKLTQQGRMA